jgi:PPE-repeat protein
MKNDGMIDRKTFLTWSLAAVGGAALGCAQSEPQTTGAAGTGGGAGTGAAGTGAAGTGAAGTGAAGTGAAGQGAAGQGAAGQGAAGQGAAGQGAAGQGAAGQGAAGQGAAGQGAAGQGAAGQGAAGQGAAGQGAAGTGGGAPNCGTKLKITITANHEHVVNMTMADVMAAVTKVYNCQGGSGHPHRIQVTAQDFMDLQMGKEVRKASCDDGHEHEYIFNCVGGTGVANDQIAAFCETRRTCGDSMTGNFCPTPPNP